MLQATCRPGRCPPEPRQAAAPPVPPGPKPPTAAANLFLRQPCGRRFGRDLRRGLIAWQTRSPSAAQKPIEQKNRRTSTTTIMTPSSARTKTSRGWPFPASQAPPGQTSDKSEKAGCANRCFPAAPASFRATGSNSAPARREPVEIVGPSAQARPPATCHSMFSQRRRRRQAPVEAQCGIAPHQANPVSALFFPLFFLSLLLVDIFVRVRATLLSGF